MYKLQINYKEAQGASIPKGMHHGYTQTMPNMIKSITSSLLSLIGSHTPRRDDTQYWLSISGDSREVIGDGLSLFPNPVTLTLVLTNPPPGKD